MSVDIIIDYFDSIFKIHLPLENALKLENLNTNKSLYPGDIPSKLIVKCAWYLSVPLTAIFNQCFVGGIFPVCFKRAIISLIPKNKTPKIPSDLRPILKISIFSKIFESFIYNFLFDNIQDKTNPNQFGFMLNHSTTQCLFYILDTAFIDLEINSSYVESFFADISKAFDKLDHQAVLYNARSLGTRDFVLRMVASFLSGREQCVCLP